MKKQNTNKNINVTSSKASNQNQNRRRKRNNRNRNRRFEQIRKNVSHGNAPVAVSDDLQQYVQFGSGSKESSLRMTACVPLTQIGGSSYHSSTLTIGGFKSPTYATNSSFPYFTLSSTQLNYVESSSDTVVDYLSPIFKLIATSFVRYRVLKLKFIYEPQSATDIKDRLVFAYANDPAHPMVQQSNLTATQANLLALSDSVAFAPWRSWSLDVSSEVKQDLLYTYNQTTTSTLDNRFNMFGAMGCVPSLQPTSETVGVVYGILYAQIQFEFIEFCPLIQGFTASTYRELNRAGYQKPCDNVECKRCTKCCITKTPLTKGFPHDD